MNEKIPKGWLKVSFNKYIRVRDSKVLTNTYNCYCQSREIELDGELIKDGFFSGRGALEKSKLKMIEFMEKEE